MPRGFRHWLLGNSQPQVTSTTTQVIAKELNASEIMDAEVDLVTINLEQLLIELGDRSEWVLPVLDGNQMALDPPYEEDYDGKSYCLWWVLRYYLTTTAHEDEMYPMWAMLELKNKGMPEDAMSVEQAAEDILRYANWPEDKTYWGQFWYRKEYFAKRTGGLEVKPLTQKKRGRY